MPPKNKGSFYVPEEKLISMVEALQRGEPNAEYEIHEAFYGYLERYFRKKVSDQDDVEELVEDTLFTACRKINKLKEPVAFVGWLKRIAYRKCYHYYNKRERVVRYSSEVMDDQQLPAILPAVKSPGLGPLKSELYEIIDQLPDKQRQATRLRLDGYKVKEIAVIQDVSIGTVKSRLNYGRIKIRKNLGDYLEKHKIKL